MNLPNRRTAARMTDDQERISSARAHTLGSA